MRTLAAALLAVLTAFSAMTVSASDAEARRYRHHGGAIAFGVAAAVITGIALSRHHRRHHRRHYYSDYNDDYVYYRPRRHYYGSYSYYPRSRHYAYGHSRRSGYWSGGFSSRGHHRRWR